MNAREESQFYLDLVIQSQVKWLAVMPTQTSNAIIHRLGLELVNKFHEHGRRLWHLSIHEVADMEFEIIVNGSARGILIVRRKEEKS